MRREAWAAPPSPSASRPASAKPTKTANGSRGVVSRRPATGGAKRRVKVTVAARTTNTHRFESSATTSRCSEGIIVVGSRNSAERKWSTELSRLGQRGKMLENDLWSNAIRKTKYAKEVSKSFWEDILAQSAEYKSKMKEESTMLRRALARARKGVTLFKQEMTILRGEGGTKPETIKRVRQSMESVEDSLLDFKRNARGAYAEMMNEEKELTEYLSEVLSRAESVAAAAATAANGQLDLDSHGGGRDKRNTVPATPNRPLSSRGKTDRGFSKAKSSPEKKQEGPESEEEAELRRRLQEIDTEIEENGGERGEWRPDDHTLYLKLKAQMPNNTNAMLQKAAVSIPMQDIYTVSAHHAWSLRYHQLVSEKKQIVAQWKLAREEAASKAVMRAKAAAKRKEKAKQADLKQRLKNQREKAAAVKAWREEKRQKELQEAKEKQRKAKLRAQKKARAFLQEHAVRKADIMAKKKQKEEAAANEEIQKQRAQKAIKKAEAKRREMLRERVEARNRMDAEKRAERARRKEQEKDAARLRYEAMVEQAKPSLKVASKFKQKTALQREREKLAAFERKYGLREGTASSAVPSRPSYLGVGRATPSWMQ